MYLDFRLNFEKHFENMLDKINKTLGLLRKLQSALPKPSLSTIYKTLIRPHLGYGDIICDQTYNVSFQQKVESIQNMLPWQLQELYVEHLKRYILKS